MTRLVSRTAVLTAIAMIAFAANSVLARLALAHGQIDALSFTGARLASGAAALALILSRSRSAASRQGFGGSWRGAAALLAYALAFSLAYLMIGAATGALILFASVQIGMLAWAALKGERLGVLEWSGNAIALAALGFLVSPGLVAPPALGAGLMVVSGLSWAAYSLLGRGSRNPLADTAGNFIRCAPVAIALFILGAVQHPISWTGLAYAICSGALASGLGYAIWYAALANLSRHGAAVVQLSVPVIAAAAGVLLLAEPLSDRLIISSVGVIGGMALAIAAARWRKA